MLPFLKDRLKALMAFIGVKYRTLPHSFWGISPWDDIRRILRANEFLVDQSSISTIFDVGANEGQTAKTLRKYFPSAKIYCFEPSESAFQKLSQSIQSDHNTIGTKLALGSIIEEKIYFEYESSVLNSFESRTPVSSSDKAIRKSKITLSTVDKFCLEHKIETIDILKIDTEGFDLEVLKGAKELLLNRRVRFVYFEFFNISSKEQYSAGIDLALLGAYLSEYNFRPISFYTDFVNPIRPIGHFNALMMQWP